MSNISFSQFGFHSVGIESFQGLSYNRVNNSELSEAFHTTEIPKYSFGYVITAKIYKTKRISFSPYFGFCNMGMRTPKTLLNTMSNPQSSGQQNIELEPGEPAKSSFIHNFYSVNLGINTNLYLTKGRTKLLIQFSSEYNYYSQYLFVTKKWDINNKLIEKNSQDRTQSNEISHLNFTLSGGLGVEFSLKEILDFQILMDYRQNLKPVTPNWVTKDQLYGYGIKIGIHYNLY